jgi:hypothetical protein
MVKTTTPVLLVVLAFVLGPSANAYAGPPVAECADVYTNDVPVIDWVRVCSPGLVTR